jgi:hypothetical protein
MKTLVFALAFCTSVSLACALEALPSRSDSGPVAAAAQAAANDVTGSLPCKKITVEVDEGYGVSEHETRYDCAQQD